MKLRFPDLSHQKLQLAILILALSGVVGVLISTIIYGAGISTDSVYYIGGARNIIAGKGLISFDGGAFNSWPPLYPFTLAIFGFLFGRDPIQLANLVNALIFGLIILNTGFYIRKTSGVEPAYVLAGTTAVLISVPLFEDVLWAWSEPLFILLMILTLICMENYLAKKSVVSLIFLAICAGLASQARYQGVTLILWGFLALIFSQDGLKRKIRDVGIFLILSIIPLAAWMLRNYLNSGLPLGGRSLSDISLAQAVVAIYGIFSSWFFPAIQNQVILAILLTATGLVCLAGFYRMELWNLSKGNLASQWRVLALAVIFTLFMVISTLISQQGMNRRLMSPLYILLVILLTKGVYELVLLLRARFSPRILNAALVILYSVWVTNLLIGNILIQAKYMFISGGGFSSASFRDNDLTQSIKNTHLESMCRIYTNNPEALYILDNVQSGFSLTREEFVKLTAQGEKAGRPIVWPTEEKACLAWFNDRSIPDLLSINELQNVVRLEEIESFNRGTIYRITRKTQ